MITLRPNQTQAADAVENAYRAGLIRPLVDSCVGSGKSLIMAELARRAWARGERTILCAHTRELVEQNANACRSLGLQVGTNAAALNERTWRAPVISAAIQSVYKYAASFGPVANVFTDECHLLPHSESGMYREFHRGFPGARFPGFSGTVFRLQGGSLVEGEGAPFEKVVYTYSIIDGIRDGYLVPAFSLAAEDKIDPTKLRKRQGEYDGASQDVQMLALMDNHIAQMKHMAADRRAWLVFEASTKAAKAMTARLNEWGVPAGLVLGETPAGERAATIAAYRGGRLRCLVNVAALTTGFDVQQCDLLVMRRKTMSLGLYVQMTGRILRTIGGNIESSIAAGKADSAVLDFADNISMHGPLDFLRPKDTKSKLVSCEACGKRNASAAAKCWACDAPMTKLCPACLGTVTKGTLDCPHCDHDMRLGGEPGEVKPAKLLETPSGAALIAAFGKVAEKQGGWLPISKVWRDERSTWIKAGVRGQGVLHVQIVPDALAQHASDSRWARFDDDGSVAALLKPNGSNRNSVLQVTGDGVLLPVPMPPSVAA